MSNTQSDRPDQALSEQQRLNPWLVFAGPFIVYMLVGMLEPNPNPTATDKPHFLGWGPELFPTVYLAKITLTALAVVWVACGYPRFDRAGLVRGILYGIVGLPLWIGAAWLQRQSGLNEQFLGPTRPSFNPWEFFADEPLRLGVYLAFRFTGLALVVPVIEEFFLRGVVMRYPQDERWWQVPWGQVDRAALIAGLVIPAALHPGELLAALLWFSLIHVLYVQTRNIWACIAAHLVTNLLLGIFICATGWWWLW